MSKVIRTRRVFLATVYIALLIGGWYLGQLFLEFSDIQIRPMNEPMVHKMLMTSAGIFIIASALPFVPGAEIGFALIFLFGKSIAFLVYVSMVSALTIAYLAGLLVPTESIVNFFRFLGMDKAHRLINDLSSIDAHQKLEFLTQKAPHWFVPFLLRHRYLAIIILFNLPGNSLVGGGGGIAFTVGMSGMYSFPKYLIAVAIAVAPVPVFFLLTGA